MHGFARKNEEAKMKILAVCGFVALALTYVTVSSGAVRKQNFPESGCPAHPKVKGSAIGCRYLGKPDDTPTYEIIFGQKNIKLLEFTRSAEVVRGDSPYGIAVNSYEGSNFTNCYVFWDARNPKAKLSLEESWNLHETLIPVKYRRSISQSDHKYYTCSGWNGNSIKVEARWDLTGGSYLVGMGTLSHNGILSGTSFRVDTDSEK
jgi:hypothetical protein